MLELNTDRILFTIGAVLIGGAIMFGIMDSLPSTLAMWSYGASDSMEGVNVAHGETIDILNPDFEQGGSHWGSSTGVEFKNGKAHVPSSKAVYTTVGVPDNSDVKISFKASGSGSVDVGFTGASGKEATRSYREMYLFESNGVQNVTVTRKAEHGSRIEFRVKEGSELILDSVEVMYLGAFDPESEQ